MKKFLLLHYGFVTPTKQIGEAWEQWYESIADRIIDPGSPFGYGRELTHDGTNELPLSPDSLTGYTIINAADMDEAEAIGQTCPTIKSMSIYEADSM